MQSLAFFPLTNAARAAVGATPPTAAAGEGRRTFAVIMRGAGLDLVPLDEGAQAAAGQQGDGEVVAVLWATGSGATAAWYLLPRSERLAINGLCPPLPLARLEPGGLLGVGRECWMVAAVWQPQPMPAPPELAAKKCPVCGGPLSLAPVVQCGECGRWTHLERPDEPNSTEALNCFLAGGMCGECKRPASLAPQITPEPPEKLLSVADEPIWDEIEPLAIHS